MSPGRPHKPAARSLTLLAPSIGSETSVLEMITSGAALGEILDAITRAIDSASAAHVSSILLVGKDGACLRHGAAPALPASYSGVIDGIPIGEGVGVCGTAAHRRAPVFVEDTYSDPLCASFKHVFEEYGLRSCWSTPVFDSEGTLLATLALYGKEPGLPAAAEVDLIGRAAHLISIAVERDRDESALRANEAMLRMASHVSRLGAWRVELPTRTVIVSQEIRAIREADTAYNPSIEEIFDHYPPEHRANVVRAFDTCVGEGLPFDIEAQLQTQKGRLIWVRVMGEAVHGTDGAIIAVQGALQDITERKHAEQHARHMEERLAGTLETISEAFVTLDRDWRFTYLNLEAEHILQRKRADLLGKVVWDEYPQAGGPAFEHAYREAVATGKPAELEEYYPGLGCWFNVRAFPSAEGLAIYFKDVTEKRRTREVLAISEERFRLLARATNDAIWDWNLLANLIWWNEGFETLFGYRRDDIEPDDSSWTTRIHPDDKERAVSSIHEVIRSTGEHWQSEYRFKRADGSYAYVLDRGYVLRDTAGKATRMIGGMTDITARKAAEMRLAEQAALLDQASDAILVRDMDNRVQYWNRRAEQVYGWTAEEALGRSVAELIYRDPAPLVAATGTLLEAGEWTGELEHRTKDGAPLTVLCRLTLLRNDRGEPKSILAINSDITERKRLEQQFLRSQRMESIGTLASGIAHDLNNVLAPILMSVEMLRADVESAESLRMLDTLASSAKRGASLIKQVLGFARGIDGRPVDVNPANIACDIEKIVRDTFPRSIDFRLETVPGLWAVHIDPTQLHQILMNLCVNARDAMPNGGQLSVRLENLVVDDVFAGMNVHAKPGPYVMLRVADTGTGMPREVQEKIFEPFFTTKEVGKGTGLGLSTTFTIVKNHGGFINVYSEPGKGTRFKIYLPAVTTGAAAIEEAALEQSRLPRGNGELVLLVDDEENVRVIAAKALERYGYQVITACNGAEGVSLFLQRRADIAVVLTDMSMPVMDGPAMIVALKSIDPAVRIIGSSGLAANGDVAKALGAGVTYFVPKPYTAETLLTTLRQILTGLPATDPIAISTAAALASGGAPDTPAAAPAGEAKASVAKVIPAPAKPVPSGVRLLLVEDDPALRVLAERMLHKQGHEVISAQDGIEALEILAREGDTIHLVLTDINMPRLDGEGLYHEAIARHGHRKFIFMSGTTEVPPSLLPPGTTGTFVLPKPYAPDDLRETIRRALSD